MLSLQPSYSYLSGTSSFCSMLHCKHLRLQAKSSRFLIYPFLQSFCFQYAFLCIMDPPPLLEASASLTSSGRDGLVDFKASSGDHSNSHLYASTSHQHIFLRYIEPFTHHLVHHVSTSSRSQDPTFLHHIVGNAFAVIQSCNGVEWLVFVAITIQIIE